MPLVVHLELVEGLATSAIPRLVDSLACASASERFTAGARRAILSLNDDMSGGAIMRQSLEVFLWVEFEKIIALLAGSIYGRSRGELLWGWNGQLGYPGEAVGGETREIVFVAQA